MTLGMALDTSPGMLSVGAMLVVFGIISLVTYEPYARLVSRWRAKGALLPVLPIDNDPNAKRRLNKIFSCIGIVIGASLMMIYLIFR